MALGGTLDLQVIERPGPHTNPNGLRDNADCGVRNHDSWTVAFFSTPQAFFHSFVKCHFRTRRLRNIRCASLRVQLLRIQHLFNLGRHFMKTLFYGMCITVLATQITLAAHAEVNHECLSVQKTLRDGVDFLTAVFATDLSDPRVTRHIDLSYRLFATVDCPQRSSSIKLDRHLSIAFDGTRFPATGTELFWAYYSDSPAGIWSILGDVTVVSPVMAALLTRRGFSDFSPQSQAESLLTQTDTTDLAPLSAGGHIGVQYSQAALIGTAKKDGKTYALTLGLVKRQVAVTPDPPAFLVDETDAQPPRVDANCDAFTAIAKKGIRVSQILRVRSIDAGSSQAIEIPMHYTLRLTPRRCTAYSGLLVDPAAAGQFDELGRSWTSILQHYTNYDHAPKLYYIPNANQFGASLLLHADTIDAYLERHGLRPLESSGGPFIEVNGPSQIGGGNSGSFIGFTRKGSRRFEVRVDVTAYSLNP